MLVLEVIDDTQGLVPCNTAPTVPVLLLTLTLTALVGVTDAVICELGVVVTVHWLDGNTEPITIVLELIENEPSTLPMVLVLEAIEVTQGEVPC